MADTAKKGVRGKYTNPANEQVPCPNGCGKRGRAGSVATHAKHFCPRRPHAPAPVAAPAVEPAPAAPIETTAQGPASPAQSPPASRGVAARVVRILIQPIPRG